ncbi:cation:proton antiporter [Actinocorallia sp. API 0066]|uniref:cation:proton antiporter n=1 Tax=Actinocorallia sp. API 0066 TaxID=2896846 RepID=UPI001E4628EC|nr:cation:proton antiporter [Actinocorallia sp. API 0066]MCD0452101.1 cation:proton antiporter [Actinocorallia sp. API 0066]
MLSVSVSASGAPVPTLPADVLLVFLLQVGVLLLLAVALGQLARRLGMPAVVGELSAGVIMGPSIADHLFPGFTEWLLPKDPSQFHLLDAAAQLGVLLLVGLTGMQLDLGMVKRRGWTAARVSLCGLIVPLGLGIVCGLLLPATLLGESGDRGVFAFFLGVAMCVSAIPVIAKTLMDMGLLHRNIGQLTLTAGMFDDAVGWFLLSIVSAMATVGVTTGAVAESLGNLVLVVVAAFLLRPLVRRLLRAAGDDHGRAVAVMVVLTILGAAATHALHLEAVFGAFVAGVVMGSTGEVTAERLAPLRLPVLAFLAPLFFATAGLRMDLTALAEPAVFGAAVVVLAVAIAGKFLGAFAGAAMSGLNRWEALALGAGMNARGVVEVVVAMVGLRLGVLGTETFTIIVLVAIVTSLMAPPILRFAMRRVETTAEEELRESAFNAPTPDPAQGKQ